MYLYWIGAILAIGLLIVVHETGHYVVARWCRMRVERFSIGFGPALTGWRSKSGTFFQIAPIPFGGFVEIKGMNIAEEVDPDDHAAYPNRPAWQRFVTIFAGPATNYLTAVVLALMLFSFAGIAQREVYYGVSSVKSDSPAAGVLEPGDRILSMNGTRLWINGPDDEHVGLIDAVQGTQHKVDPDHPPAVGTQGVPIKVAFERDGQTIEKELTPIFTDEPNQGKAWRIGVVPSAQSDRVRVGPIGVVTAAVRYPVDKTVEIATGLYQIVTGKAKAVVKGPSGMAEMVKDAFVLGWIDVFELMMMLNVYLGLFNLLPLPALDGGRLVFLGYEMATRRRANPRVEATVHMVGILILAVIMVLVTFKDCVHIAGG